MSKRRVVVLIDCPPDIRSTLGRLYKHWLRAYGVRVLAHREVAGGDTEDRSMATTATSATPIIAAAKQHLQRIRAEADQLARVLDDIADQEDTPLDVLGQARLLLDLDHLADELAEVADRVASNFDPLLVTQQEDR